MQVTANNQDCLQWPDWRCASGCVVECQICNREVAGSNLSLGYFTPRFTQPSIPPGSVNEYQLWLGRQRQVCLIPIVDERVGVQVKLWNPLRTHAIPERFCGGDSLQIGTISSICTFTFYLLIQSVTRAQCIKVTGIWYPPANYYNRKSGLGLKLIFYYTKPNI